MLREFLWGTQREINADKRLGELQGKSKLSPKQEGELPELKHLSRRLFLRRSATVIGAVAILSSPVAGLILEQGGKLESDEDKFFSEISQLSTSEQVARIDDYYSRNKLDVKIAKERVLPVWVKNYIDNSGSDQTPEELLSHVILFTNDNRTSDQAKEELGRVKVLFPERYKGPVEINFSTFVSNSPVKQKTEGSTAPGIIFLRSEVTHEISHFDTVFRDNAALGGILNNNRVFPVPIPNPDQMIINGFSFVTVAPDKSYNVFFVNFDEIATDAVTSYILDKGNHKMVFGYNQAAILRKFLDWIEYPGDKFIEHHRNSDLQALARDLGNYSSRFSKIVLNSDQDVVVRGMGVISVFSSGRPEEMEKFFPGFMSNVMDKPPLLIR